MRRRLLKGGFFSRQELTLGKNAQEKLDRTAVAIVGAGGVGSHSARLCAQMGFGRIIIFDADKAEESNAARSGTYGLLSTGKNKAVETVRELRRLFPGVRAEANIFSIGGETRGALGNADIVLDCTDNYQARRQINAFCLETGKPWVYAAAIRNEAMVSTIVPGKTPCFECWATKPKTAATCRDIGVLPTAPALAASVQVSEAANLAIGKPALAGKLFYADAATGTFGTRALAAKKACGCRNLVL